MTDSSDPFAKFEAKILSQAQRDIAELRRLASKYNLQIAHGEKTDEVQAELEEASPQAPSSAPESQLSQEEAAEAPSKSGYVRHAKPWTETIFDVVKSERCGLTIKDLKGKIAETHLGERLGQTEAAFYGAISKLKIRSWLIEHKGHLYTPDTLAQFRRDVAAGLVDDVEAPASKGQTSPAKGAILRYIATHGSATTGELIKMLLTNRDTKKKTSEDKKPVYNLLNRLTKRGELVKCDGRYCLPSQKNEAPIAEASGASSPDEAATSSQDSEKIHKLFR